MSKLWVFITLKHPLYGYAKIDEFTCKALRENKKWFIKFDKILAKSLGEKTLIKANKFLVRKKLHPLQLLTEIDRDEAKEKYLSKGKWPPGWLIGEFPDLSKLGNYHIY